MDTGQGGGGGRRSCPHSWNAVYILNSKQQKIRQGMPLDPGRGWSAFIWLGTAGYYAATEAGVSHRLSRRPGKWFTAGKQGWVGNGPAWARGGVPLQILRRRGPSTSTRHGPFGRRDVGQGWPAAGQWGEEGGGVTLAIATPLPALLVWTDAG